ncbi:MAG: hypothetical protein CVT84_12720 [Alphaproteobacteria bacterium HGW-Alphaproteobacteria-6]|nr:MAG: hypothetical protein CVT84_12720 [Alphaproteobacteria bacterium HGW-Alphaproteobacteria-6]
MSRGFLVLVLALALLGGVAVAGWLALQACGLRSTVLTGWLPGACPSAETLAARARLEALRQRQDDLLRQIRASERELTRVRCEAVHDQPPALREAELPPPPPQIDEEAWRAGDIGVLEGCWALDSDYRVVNRQTGQETAFTAWSMCFAAGPQGQATMRSPGGLTCSGSVSGTFDGAGRIIFDEAAALGCSDGSQIFRRVLTCSLAGDGTALCNSNQPEVGGNDTVRLRRSAEGN